ncbi:MAG: hypothetical protein WAN36_11380 [Calditrichia bacterium]
MRVFKYLVLLSMVFALFTLITGCDGDEQNDFYNEKAQMRKNIQDKMAAIDRQIEQLDQRIDNADDEMEDRLEERKENLEDAKEELEDKMDDLDDASEQEWNQFKAGVNKTFNKIDRELEDIEANIEGERD